MKYILSIDQGTTGTTACLIKTSDFSFCGKVNKEYPQIYPAPSYVEHNLHDIWSTVESTTKELLLKYNINPKNIVAIGITNQRETTCAFNHKGEPLCNAIVWQDKRTAEICANLIQEKWAPTIKAKTGLPIDPYFSATKMQWLLKNNQNVLNAQKNNDLFFGTVDTFLLYKLTAGKSFKTDASNASRTMLMDLKTCQWDPELLQLFGIKSSELPTIEDSFGHFGITKNLSFLPDDIPITGILGDQQAALFGNAGAKEGESKCTYGTGAFMLLNTGRNLIYSNAGLLTTIHYKHKNDIIFALEGSSYIAGAAVQWLRDNLHMISKSAEIETLARKITDLATMNDVLFMPYFSGIGTPHWRPEAKASLLGLSRDTNNAHIAFAVLEGMAFSIHELVKTFRKETGLPLKELKVDGGAVENNLLMELQANISNTKIIRPKIIETTAYGAALGAGVGLGIITIDAIFDLWKSDRFFDKDHFYETYIAQKNDKWTALMNTLYLNNSKS